MFTGIIRHIGKVTRFERQDKAAVMEVVSDMSDGLEHGDSVAVNGACLTVLETSGDTMKFRLMDETLKRTSLGSVSEGGRVNLERPVQAGETFDGHFVMGHVDGVCETVKIEEIGGDKIFTFKPSAGLLSYLIEKGSVSLDGVSLTVVQVKDDGSFTVSMMPYTLEHTTFGVAKVGDTVNVEVDMIGKYVERFMDHWESRARGRVRAQAGVSHG